MSKVFSLSRFAVTAKISRFFIGPVLCVFLAVMAILLMSPRVIYAQDATIENVVVANSNTNLLLYCSVANSFTPEMLEGVHNGIPVTFTYFVNLEEERSFFPDREIVSFSFNHTLSYDTLKEEYQISSSLEPGKTVTSSSFDQAKRLMADVDGLRVTALNNLRPEGKYVLSIKARLAKKTLPLNFHYVVPFWHLWDFETDWQTVEFRY